VRLAIKGKVYDAVVVEELTLKNMLLFEKQTAEFGLPLTWDQVIAWHAEIDALPPAEQASHPRLMTLTACSIWAARVAAGEPVTFEEAIDIPAAAITVLPDPEDHKPKATAGKAPARKATGQRGRSPAKAARG
jgi:hypothetical protein